MTDEKDNEIPDVELDFFEFMNETIKREAARKVILPKAVDPNVAPPPPSPKEPYNPNREYQRRYAHKSTERFWIGPRRYQ